jgi:hypothetical protein
MISGDAARRPWRLVRSPRTGSRLTDFLGSRAGTRQRSAARPAPGCERLVEQDLDLVGATDQAALQAVP